jgi:WD40 repeat protein
VTGVNGQLVLRDGKTLARVGEIPTSLTDFAAGTFAPDGRLLATAGKDGKIHLWDLRRREYLVGIDLGAGPVTKLVFTPNGRAVRFVAEKQAGELDLHAFDNHIEGNLTRNLQLILPDLDRPDVDRVLDRLRRTHPDAYRAVAPASPAGGS